MPAAPDDPNDPPPDAEPRPAAPSPAWPTPGEGQRPAVAPAAAPPSGPTPAGPPVPPPWSDEVPPAGVAPPGATAMASPGVGNGGSPGLGGSPGYGGYGGYGVAHAEATATWTPPRWGMGDVAVGVGLYFGAQVVAGIVLVVWALATGQLDAGTNADELTEDLTFVSVLLGVPLAWVALFGWPWWLARRKGSGSLARDFGWAFRPLDVATGIAGGVVGLIAAASAGLLFQWIVGHDAPTNTDIIPEDISPLLMVLVFFVIAVGTPVAEEMFFRGLFLGAARKRWGTAIAVVVSSVGFGLAHVQPSLTAWLYVGAVTGSYGVVFAMLRVWSEGRLAAPIIAHMTVNAAGVAAVFLTS